MRKETSVENYKEWTRQAGRSLIEKTRVNDFSDAGNGKAVIGVAEVNCWGMECCRCWEISSG